MKKEKKEIEKELEKEKPEIKEGHENEERNSFEEEKKAYLSEKLEFEAAKLLSEEDLPVSFAKILKGADSEATKENIALFKKEFMKALEAALSERLKGTVPKTGAAEVYDNDPFLAGFNS